MGVLTGAGCAMSVERPNPVFEGEPPHSRGTHQRGSGRVAAPALPAGAGSGGAIEHADVPPGYREGRVGYSIKSIHSINTVDQTFGLRARLYLEWEEPDAAAARARGGEYAKAFLARVREPVLRIANALECEEIESERTHTKFAKPRAGLHPNAVYISMLLHATLQAPMLLHAFPFDHQVLPIVVQTPKTEDKFVLRILPIRSTPDKTITPQLLTEWVMHVPQHESRTSGRVSVSRGGKGKPEFVINLHLRRRWQSYFSNVISILCLSTLAGLTALVLPPDNFSDRANLVFLLLLTAVAYKSYVSGLVPHLPYLTLLDRYVLACFYFMFGALVEALVARLLANAGLNTGGTGFFSGGAARTLDRIYLIASAIVVVVYHLVLALRLRRWYARLGAATPPPLDPAICELRPHSGIPRF